MDRNKLSNGQYGVAINAIEKEYFTLMNKKARATIQAARKANMNSCYIWKLAEKSNNQTTVVRHHMVAKYSRSVPLT